AAAAWLRPPRGSSVASLCPGPVRVPRVPCGAIAVGLAGTGIAPPEDHAALRAHHGLAQDLGTAEELQRRTTGAAQNHRRARSFRGSAGAGTMPLAVPLLNMMAYSELWAAAELKSVPQAGRAATGR